MMHKMSELRGWTHSEMLSMPKPIFYRYYGYWYQDRLREEAYQKEQELKNKQKQPIEGNWKQL
jgi:hypothetical protein